MSLPRSVFNIKGSLEYQMQWIYMKIVFLSWTGNSTMSVLGILHVKRFGRITGSKPELEKNFSFTYLNSIKHEYPVIIVKPPWRSCCCMSQWIMIFKISPNIFQQNVCVLLRPWPCACIWVSPHLFPFLCIPPSVILSLSLYFSVIAHHMLNVFFFLLYSPGNKLFIVSFTGERHIHVCSVRVTFAPRNNTDVIVIMGIVCLWVCVRPAIGDLFMIWALKHLRHLEWVSGYRYIKICSRALILNFI